MERAIDADGQRLAIEDTGPESRSRERGPQPAAQHPSPGGPPVVGLHGLTATRRSVLMGSRLLERSGRRVVVLDARGHGASAPAKGGEYSYEAMAADLEAVLDACELERAVLAGISMGAHTVARFALTRPERVAGMLLVTPAFDPDTGAAGRARWDALAAGLREGGIDGFVAASNLAQLPPAWRETAELAIRQRLAGHRDLHAVADALEAVPRARPFRSWAQLAAIEVPTVVVGSLDAADPQHPLASARAWAQAIPAARLVVEEDGRSPIAWQGGQLSRLLLELAP